MRVLALLLIVLLVAAAPGGGAVPQTISYQGVLTNAGGSVVADGAYDVTFSIYNLPEEGAALWSEEQTLTVTDGIFDAILGSVTLLDLAFDEPYWLGVAVGEDPELEPRVELAAVPYAFRALYSDAASDDDWEISGNTIYRLSGRVGIRTADPVAALHVVGDVEVDSTLYVNTISSVVPPEPAAKPEGAGPGAVEGRSARRGGRREIELPTQLRSRATSLELQTDGTTRVHIDGLSGRTGVGTETPDALLDVEGDLETDALRLPTGAGDNLVLTSDLAGNASWQQWSAGRVPNIVYPDLHDSLATAGQKIVAALETLPPEGGVIDARGLPGGTIDVNLFAGVNTKITLLLGAGTFVIEVPQVFAGTREGALEVSGEGLGTILKPTSSMEVFRLTCEKGRIADLTFDLNSTNSTAVTFSKVGWFNAEVEHVRIFGTMGTAPCLVLGEEWATAGALGAFVRDVWIWGSLTHDGIEVHAEMVVIDGCIIQQVRAGVVLDGGTSSTISNSTFGHSRHALVIDEGSYDTLLFSGNDCEAGYSGEEYIKISGAVPHYPVRNLIVRDNYFTQMNSPETDAIRLRNVRGVVIEGNRFAGGFAGTGAEAVVFEGGVTEVFIAGNIAINIEPTMPGYEDVPLQVNDVTATQSSRAGGFSEGLTVDGMLQAKDFINLLPGPAPSAPAEGDMYMDEVTHKLMVYDGLVWKACW